MVLPITNKELQRFIAMFKDQLMYAFNYFDINLFQKKYKRDKTEEKRIINIDLSIAPFSGTERRKVSKFSKVSSDFQENLRISFENLLVQDLYNNHEIRIKVSIIQADGGYKSCAFNAICLALIDGGVALQDFMVSASAAFLKG